MPKPRFHFVEDYRRLVQALMAQFPLPEAMSRAVGGSYAAIGEVEKQLLIARGLEPQHTVVDIGCGSGRLAKALVPYLTKGRFLGTDVVLELLQYAAQGCPAHWRFTLVDQIGMPYENDSADFICFFSVFTHLLHEESYCYLLEAKRVARPGGRVLFSFLEFPDNWTIFEDTVRNVRAGVPNAHLNVFMGRDMINCWAEHLGLRVIEWRTPHELFVPLSTPVVYDDGRRVEGLAALGQSLCILENTKA